MVGIGFGDRGRLTYVDVDARPQATENRMIIVGKPIRLVVHPVKHNDKQTREILGEIGYHQTEIDRLIAEKRLGRQNMGKAKALPIRRARQWC